MPLPNFWELEVSQEIAPGDPMYAYGPELYFEAGPLALNSIWLALMAAECRDIKNVLDFGCGYGRVLRTIHAAFPDADLAACDLRADAVEFCADRFGAVPVVSDPDPERSPLTGLFDLIWSGSHLTHIEKDRWTGFVRLWTSLLAPGGVMVFTVYGRAIANLLRRGENMLDQTPERAARLLRDYDERGFGFGEGLALGGGDCIAQPSWVCAKLAEETPDLNLMLYREHAWLGQDVVAAALK